MKIQTPKYEFKSLAVKEGKDLHDLKNGKIIIIIKVLIKALQ